MANAPLPNPSPAPAAAAHALPFGARLYYGWLVVAATTFVLLVSAGMRSAPGVFLLPAEISLGVDRAAIAVSASVGLLMYGAAGPLSGWLLNRMGVRLLTTIGIGLAALGMILSLYATEVWQLTLLWGLISGIGTGIVGSVLGAAVAARWFVARRGMVVGIFGAAGSAGQLIFVPLLMGLASSIGWRAASLWLGVVALFAIIPALIFLRNDPAQVGLRPYGAPPEMPATMPTAHAAATMRSALRSGTFWLLAITFFICGATSNGLIGTHLIPFAIECGIPQAAAAGSLALLGAMNFVGTLASGFLTDRHDPRKLLLIFYGFRGLSLLLLPLVDGPVGLSLFALLFGLDYIATVPPTIALISDRFGREHVGIVYGWVFLAHQLGAAGAAWLGGVARATYGDYTLAFLTAGVIAVAAGFMALRIGARAMRAPLAA